MMGIVMLYVLLSIGVLPVQVRLDLALVVLINPVDCQNSKQTNDSYSSHDTERDVEAVPSALDHWDQVRA